jgi:hypothetical protein
MRVSAGVSETVVRAVFLRAVCGWGLMALTVRRRVVVRHRPKWLISGYQACRASRPPGGENPRRWPRGRCRRRDRGVVVDET